MLEGEPQFDLFISYNRLDQQVVEPLAQALAERGLKLFKDDWYLKPGEFWPTALERNLAASRAALVAVGSNGLGPWQQREAVAALDRQNKATRAGKPFPVIPLLLGRGSESQAGLAFLLQNTWVARWDPRAADLIVGAAQGKAPAELYDESNPDPRATICPYRGLRFFREEDAGFYFGRDADNERLIAALDHHAMVCVVGASGSGKSSLARAGLIPYLRRQAGDAVWQVLDMMPGSRPFRSLARALLPLREPRKIGTWSKGTIDDEADRLAQRLDADGGEHLVYVSQQILDEEPGTKRLLLLVDQWEELYTHRPRDGETAEDRARELRRFVGMLLHAVAAKASPLKVVLTLRADYWGEVLNDAALANRLTDEAVVHLRALDRAALEKTIRGPAQAVGLTVPDDLVEALLNDANGQPGDLALLEYALQELWKARDQGAQVLMRSAYQDMGGLQKAIVSRAETVYAALGGEERAAVPGVFAALVQVGEARTDLRRRAPLAELGDAGQRVARRLADERLLVTSRDAATGQEQVEVAHEALLRHWPKLGEWIEQRRTDLLAVRQLQADAANWVTKGRKAEYLWSHERVREVAAALRKIEGEVRLTGDEREFLGPYDSDAIITEIERPDTTHARRALLGERLAVLGDPRLGVGVGKPALPKVAWCPALPEPAFHRSRVSIRVLSNANDPYSDVVSAPEKTVGAFRITRYPVTVAQYRAFIEAEDGWRDTRWWGDDLYRDPEGDSYEFGRYGNQPAVYVSWFDAMAYCRWLGARLKLELRLPDEWEWQLAATGGEAARTYPWGGDDWDAKGEPWLANTFESRLGRATAVGMYPAGATPQGALDMGGTVWEWCLSKFDPPEESASSSNDFDYRVLRGGSWGSEAGYARGASRFRIIPSSRNHNVGFRVLCSSPIVEH